MDRLQLLLLERNANKGMIEFAIEESKLNDDEVYNEFCEFYDKSEILNFHIAEPVREFIVDYIVKYRWNRPSTGLPSKPDIPGRINLITSILDEHLTDFSNIPNTEKVHLLLFLARTMNVLCFANDEQVKVPWTELRFLICIFVATKTDPRHTKYPLIDLHFQFLVNEELILNALEKVLRILKSGNPEKFTEVEEVYKMTKYYYFLQKISYHLNVLQNIDRQLYFTVGKVLERNFQVIGECLLVIERIDGCKSKIKVNPLMCFCSYEKLKENFISMRNTLSHAKNKIEFFNKIPDTRNLQLQIDIMKMDIKVSDLIFEEQRLIKERFLLKLTSEQSLEIIFRKISVIDTQQINNWRFERHSNFEKREWFIELVGHLISSALTHNKNQHIKLINKSVEIAKALNTFSMVRGIYDFSNTLLNYFRRIKKEQPCVYEIKKTLKTIYQNINKYKLTESFTLTTIIMLLMDFSDFLSEIKEKHFIAFIAGGQRYLNEMEIYERTLNISGDRTISNILESINNAFTDPEEKLKFKTVKNDLLYKRDLCENFKIFGSFDDLKEKWPKNDKNTWWNNNKLNYKDPLHLINVKSNQNLPEFEIVDCFLKKIKMENRLEVVNKIRYLERIKLKNNLLKANRELQENIFLFDNHFAKEMNTLDCLEILKLLGTDFVVDRNYMDFPSVIPVGRMLRNYLAHGDIYLDLFLRDTKEIVASHLDLINNIEDEIPLCQGLSRLDDFNAYKESFYKRKEWITFYINDRRNENSFKNYNIGHSLIMTVRARDVSGSSIVHHNLKICDKNNSFFMYLIEKLSFKSGFIKDGIFDLMLLQSTTPNYKKFAKTNLVLEMEPSFRDYFIDDFINEKDPFTQRYMLCQILCFNCPDMDVFKEIYNINFNHSNSNLLHLSCLFNQTCIVEYLLEIEMHHIDSLSENKTALQCAILANNFELAKYLVDKGANIEGMVEKSTNVIKLNTDLTSSCETPVILAFRNGNLDIVKLLLNAGARLDYKSIYVNLKYNCNTNICEYLVDRYPDLINHKEDALIFSACRYRNEKLVKFLVEKGANLKSLLEDNFTVLMEACRCFNDIKIIKYLIQNGAPTQPKGTIITPLTNACERRNIEMAKMLLQYGAYPTKENSVCSPLNEAIKSQSIPIMEELFQRGAKINENTIGVSMGNVKPKVFDYLISKDERINWVVNCLKVVIFHDNTNLLKSILKHLEKSKYKLKFTHFYEALQSNKCFRLLVNYPYTRLSDTEWGELLSFLCDKDDNELVKIIIAKGVDINQNLDNTSNSTLLHLISYGNYGLNKTLLKYCLIKGADLRAKDANQLTAVQVAAKCLDEQSFREYINVILEIKKPNIKILYPK